MAKRAWSRAATTGALVLSCLPALAEVGYYVVVPYSDPGASSVKLRYWTTKLPNRPETVWPEAGFAYGINSRWTTELYATNIGRSIGKSRLDSLNWQNDLLLTQGQYPVDVAVHTTLTHGVGEGNSVEFGPEFQTDVGRTQLNLNLFLERALGKDRTDPTELKYQWQVRHRWMPGLHVGLQGFGELGPWNHWATWAGQSHRAGPALFGRVGLGDRQALEWQAAFLRGSVFTRTGHMFTAQLKYAY
jgi:hypothetical protein